MSEQSDQCTPNYERSVADMQREIDARQIVALGKGLLRQVNPITSEHEVSELHYIHSISTWITREQALTVGETILEAHNAKTFENLVLDAIREPTA